MSISVATPKDLSKIKPKFIGNFTKRQVFSLGSAALIGFPFYFLTKNAIGTDAAAILMVAVMLPFFLFITDNLRYGLPAEKIIVLMWRHNRLPGIRLYQAENLFIQLEEREKLKKEVLFLEEKARSGRKQRKRSSNDGAGKDRKTEK
ncbi:MAG: PrgI family protein [Lachnospiraceae bacterium]|nr:PrgI family protein [Lachnospiraceae bacterium]